MCQINQRIFWKIRNIYLQVYGLSLRWTFILWSLNFWLVANPFPQRSHRKLISLSAWCIDSTWSRILETNLPQKLHAVLGLWIAMWPRKKSWYNLLFVIFLVPLLPARPYLGYVLKHIGHSAVSCWYFGWNLQKLFQKYDKIPSNGQFSRDKTCLRQNWTPFHNNCKQVALRVAFSQVCCICGGRRLCFALFFHTFHIAHNLGGKACNG